MSALRKMSLVAAVVLLAAASVLACNVPVFRYALEKWDAGTHEVLIFHRGELDANAKAALVLLRESAEAQPRLTNIAVRVVDLSEQPPPEDLNVYRSLKNAELPAMVVRFPKGSASETPYWQVALNTDNVKSLLHSPARKQISDRLLQGTSAVWVFLASGNKQKDAAAEKLLAEELRVLETKLKLPELTDSPEDRLSSKDVPLKLQFSILRLSRTESAERLLIEMLLSTEADLRDFDEPMVFPVYGRGRALYALIGKGINQDTIREAGAFLVGPCTCTIKEQNPGVDLLMTAHWDSILVNPLVKDRALPPLTGLEGFLPPKTEKKNQQKDSGNRQSKLGAGDQEWELDPPSTKSVDRTVPRNGTDAKKKQ